MHGNGVVQRALTVVTAIAVLLAGVALILVLGAPGADAANVSDGDTVVLENRYRTGKHLWERSTTNVEINIATDANAQWVIGSDASGTWLQNVASGRFLDADGPYYAGNVDTIAVREPSSYWNVIQNSDGSVAFRNVETNGYLDGGASNSDNVDQSAGLGLDDGWFATIISDPPVSAGADPSDFQPSSPVLPINGSTGELSGVAVNGNGELFAVDDNGTFVALTENVADWSSTPIWDPWQRLQGRDIEGLTWISGDRYAVAFEIAPYNSSASALQIIEVRTWGNFRYIRPLGSVASLPTISTAGNTGLQGIVYSPSESNAATYVFYGVEEDAPTLWRIDYDVATSTASTAPGVSIASNDLAGVAIPPGDANSVFVLSDSVKSISKFGLPGGQAQPGAGTIDVGAFGDPEGLAFFGDTLYVVGEGSQIASYTATVVPAAGIGLADIRLDGQAADAMPGPLLPVGPTSLTFTIENTGDIALDLVLTTPPSSCTGSLAVGQTRNCTATVNIVDPAMSPVSITVTADAAGQPVSASGDYYYQAIPLIVEVSLSDIAFNGLPAGAAPGPQLPVGPATLTFTVENTGEVALSGLSTTPASSCSGSLAVDVAQVCAATVQIVDPAVSPDFVQVVATGNGQTVNADGLRYYRNLPEGAIVINEIETQGGSPGDWVELFNPSNVAIDIGGYTFRDNNNGPYTIPSPTIVDAGEYFVIDKKEGAVLIGFDFGLGGSDSAILRDTTGLTVSSYSWSSHAGNSWALCPNGNLNGAYADATSVTKGGENDCAPPTAGAPWPGGAGVVDVDVASQFTEDLSGLDYDTNAVGGPVLWASVNGDSLLHRLVESNGQWVPESGAWANGKTIRYTNGGGVVDAEGVTIADNSSEIYVASERNDTPAGENTSLNMVLRYDTTAASPITAAIQWDLTASLPTTGNNSGLEGITWVPDGVLTAQGFVDQSTNAAYDPGDYPGHGTGLFFLALEDAPANNLFAYALMDNNGAATFTQIASIDSGLPKLMALEFDTDTGDLWAGCDKACDGKSSVLRVNAAGAFESFEIFADPTGMPFDPNDLTKVPDNEGLAIAPLSECVSSVRPVFWADDADFGLVNAAGHSLREGTLTCNPL